MHKNIIPFMLGAVVIGGVVLLVFLKPQNTERKKPYSQDKNKIRVMSSTTTPIS